jgi:hypothetical protein
MNVWLLAVALVVIAAPAEAEIPLVNATCGNGVEVHADAGGPIFINGQEGSLKTFNENYYEATQGDVTISLSINPDGSPSLSATWKGGGSGVCQVASSDLQKGGIPLLNAACGNGVEVHANKGGPIFINGNEGTLKIFNENYYEAQYGDVTISLSINPDGTPVVSATWRGGANGICQISGG